MKNIISLVKLIVCMCLVGVCASSAFAANITKDPSGSELTSSASWTGGIVPTNIDSAIWASGSLGGSLTMSGPMTWSNMTVTASTAPITISGAGPLSIGWSAVQVTGPTILLNGNVDLNLATTVMPLVNANINNNPNQFQVNPGRTLTVSGPIVWTPASGGIWFAAAGNGTAYNLGSGGTTVFAGTNVFNSNVYIGIGNAGTLMFSSITNAFSSNNIAWVQIGGSVGNCGTLLYTNNTGAYDAIRFPINYTGGNASGGIQCVDMSGTGLLELAGASAGIAFNSTGAGSRAIFLQGSTSGAGLVSGTIVNSGTAANLTAVLKRGTGTWTLSGVNSYRGATTNEQGILIVGTNSPQAGPGAFGTASPGIALGDSITISSNWNATLLNNGPWTIGQSITVGASTAATTGIYTLGNTTANNSTFSGAITLNQNLVVTQATGGTLTISGAIGGAGGLTTTGNTVILSGANTFAGNTVINGSLLIYSNTAAATLGGGVSGTGTLQVSGPGGLLISGADSVPTTVMNGGLLIFLSTQTAATTVTVNNGSGFGVNLSGTSQYKPATLTLGTGCSLVFSNIDTTTAPLAPVSMTFAGTLNVNVRGISGGSAIVGANYPLLTYAGITVGNFNLVGNPTGVTGELTVTGNTLYYKVDTAADIWNTATAGNWDILTSPNWTGGAAANSPVNTYKDGDSVIFNDGVAGPVTVSVTAPVNPGSLIFLNGTTAYTIASSGGSIGGSTGLNKIGAGSLTLTGGGNTYSGATTISAGTVNVGVLANNSVPSDLGEPGTADSGKLVVNGATLAYTGSTAGTDRGVTVGANNATISVANAANTLTIGGVVAGPGMLTTAGNGILNLSGANTYSGGTTISAGTLKLGSSTALGSGTNIANNATLDVNGQALPFTDLVTFGNNSTLANSGGSVTNNMQSFVAGNFHITLTGTANMTFNWLNGSGFPNWNTTNNITGTVDLAGTNDNSGMLYFQNSAGTTLLDKTNATGGAGSANSANVYNGLVRESGSQQHQLYSGGTILINGPGTFDMNGLNEMVGSLQSTALGGTLKNDKAGTVSTLTMTGGATYTGTITDGAGKIAIVETNGGGTEFLAGTNSFTGGISVYAGNLNYGGYWYNNDPIMDYGVKIAGGTATFNIGGTYYWNYSTMSGNGIFALNNTNMVMWMTNDATAYGGTFIGPVTVNLGRLHLVGDQNTFGPEVMSTVTVANFTNAILEVEDSSIAPAKILGSLVLNANSTLQFDWDGSGNSFQVQSNLTAAGATVTVKVIGAPLTKNAGGYTLMTYGGTLSGSFSPVPVITGAGLSSGLYSYITFGNGAVKLVVVDAYIWTHLGNGNWSLGGNWSLQPIAAGQIATFGNSAPATFTTVNLDGSYTIGGVVFNNTNSFAITTSGQTLTMGNSGGGSTISALAGTSNSIAVPLVLGENTAVSVANGGMNLTLSGILSGTGALTKSGDGALVLSSANTYSGGTTISAGTVKLGNASSLGSAATNSVGGTGTLDLNGLTLNATPTNVILVTAGGTLQNSNASPAAVYQPISQTSNTVGYIRGNGNITVQQWSSGAAINVTNYNTGTLDLAGTNDNAFLQLHSFAGTVLLDKVGASSVHAASLLDVEGGLVKVAGTNGDQIFDANTLTVNSGTFDLNGHSELVGSLAGASSAGVILNNAAGTTNTLTVTLVTGGGSSAYNGTIKDGAGKLALVIGEAATLGGTNLFTGGLSLVGGVIGGTLTVSNTFPTNLTVSVANGSVLNLAFGVTNQIGALVLNGVTQPAGVYKTGMTGLITGTGALLIGAAAGPSGPATLTNSISGSTLTLKWPAGQNWRLVSQTNSLATGLNPSSAAWTTVSGVSDGSATITINPANPTVFYKLVYP